MIKSFVCFLLNVGSFLLVFFLVDKIGILNSGCSAALSSVLYPLILVIVLFSQLPSWLKIWGKEFGGLEEEIRIGCVVPLEKEENGTEYLTDMVFSHISGFSKKKAFLFLLLKSNSTCLTKLRS